MRSAVAFPPRVAWPYLSPATFVSLIRQEKVSVSGCYPITNDSMQNVWLANVLKPLLSSRYDEPE